MKEPFEGAKENWYRMVCKMVGEMELRINDLNKRLDKQEEIIQRLNLERSSLKIILTKAAELQQPPAQPSKDPRSTPQAIPMKNAPQLK